MTETMDPLVALTLVRRWKNHQLHLHAQAEQRIQAIITGEATDWGESDRPGRIARDALLRSMSGPKALQAKERECWTKKDIIKALREDAEQRGHTPSSEDWRTSRLAGPSLPTVRRVFGTWGSALLEAGLPRAPLGRKKP
jgi:hypothetical protein